MILIEKYFEHVKMLRLRCIVFLLEKEACERSGAVSLTNATSIGEL